ncbi:MAG: phosphoribosylanthranilate isomerase [Verrucomicrobiota bacterium]
MTPPAIKICGIRSGAQAKAIVELGADAIGINLYPRSKRYIALEEAGKWLRDLATEVQRVAVVVNPSSDDLARIRDSGLIDWVQLHGDESPDQIATWIQQGYLADSTGLSLGPNRVRSSTQQGIVTDSTGYSPRPDPVAPTGTQGSPWFKAMGIRDRAGLDRALAYQSPTLLLDAYAPNDYGGSGETMDWALGALAVKGYPEREIILAGGLTADNVANAIAQVKPAGVDVASGVESGPGIKDLAKVREFIQMAREASS